MKKLFYFALPIMAFFFLTSCFALMDRSADLLGRTAELMDRAAGIDPSQNTDEGVVINGVRWATRNTYRQGLFTLNIEDPGSFYQWNRGRAWAAEPDTIRGGWDSSATVPRDGQWEINPCPRGWRLPTRAEFQSLLSAGSVWTTQNGVYGRLFGSAPNQIFLPAVGIRLGDRNVNNRGDSRAIARGYNGFYWSSDIGGALIFSQFYKKLENLGDDSAFSMRCVAITP